MKSKKILIGYTTGVYDLFHIGHLNLLKNAKRHCDKLIVGVSTDELSVSYKNKKPIIPFEERIKILESIKYVDQAIPQRNLDKVAAWKKLHYDFIFVGNDWESSKSWQETEKNLAPLGAKVKYLPYTKHTSSTIIKKILIDIYGELKKEDEKHI